MIRSRVESLEPRQLLSAAPYLVSDIAAGSASSNPSSFTPSGNVVYFVASPTTNNQQLFVTDGTSGGTVELTSVNAAGGANPSSLTDVNGTLFFAASDPTNGTELWKSDGTVAGTSLLKDIYTGSGGLGPNSSNPHGFVAFQNELFFVANDGEGEQIWKSDGTPAGTVKVTNINEGAPTSFGDLVVQGGTLYFFGDDASTGPGLWKSDGTDAGTLLVQTTGTPPGGGGVGQLTAADNQLFFAASDPTNGYQVWVSDGTPSGTHPVKILSPVESNASNGPLYLTTVGNNAYFSAMDANGRQLWVSDGTDAGTMVLKDIHPGFAANPTSLINVNGTLYFAADENTDGVELWKSDGTTAGTALVTNINPGAASSNPSGLTDVNGTLYFNADDGTHGYQLWQSDGTPGGTQLVSVINPTGGAFENNNGDNLMATANGILFFDATDGITGQELWAYNAFSVAKTTSTTSVVSSQNPQGVGGNVQFTAYVSGAGATPTGAVTFFDGASNLGVVPLSGGMAVFNDTSLSVGNHTISAQYSGDAIFSPSTSIALTQTILNKTASTTVVTSSLNPGALGDNITFTATVSGTGGTPTGNVIFFDGGAQLGMGTLLPNGTVQLATAALSVGDHAITAQYQGDGAFAPSTSAIFTQSIAAENPASLVPDLSGSGGSLPASVVGGIKLRNTVPIVVSNPTAAPVRGSVTLALYATTDPSSITGGTLIGVLTRRLTIRSQKLIKLRIRVPAFPSTLSSGSYNVVAQLTDPQGLTRIAALPTAVQVTAPFISPAVTLGPVTPASVAPGKHGSILLTIVNLGNIPATGVMSIEIDPSSDGLTPIAGMPLLIASRRVNIRPGKSTKLRLRLTVPAALTPGQYTPLVTVMLNGVSATAAGTGFTVG